MSGQKSGSSELSPGSRSLTGGSGRRLFCLALILLCSGGCAWQTQSRLDRYNSAYNTAEYAEAAELAAEFGNTDVETGASDDLLWTLQQASALQAAGEHRAAIRLFDSTEDFFRLYDERGAMLRWGDQLLSVLTSDAALAYQGMVYDAIMVNSYKALNFMAAGERELARVELNRARDRQRRAAEYFAEELAEARQKLMDQRNSPAGSGAVQGALGRADQVLASDYQILDEWAIYPAFINPFATYLHGLFLLTQGQAAGDSGLAADALRQAHGMVPELAVVEEDWQWAEALANGTRRRDDLPRTVWVIYENGLGPARSVKRIQLPLFLFNSDGIPFWAGIAYPALDFRNPAQPALDVRLVAGDQARSETLASIDAVVANEFRQRLPTIVTRAVVAAVAKAAAQYQIQEQAHPVVALLGLLYQVVSTQADTRQWTSLPKTIEIAKLERTRGDDATGTPDQLVISGPEDQVVALPDSQFTLVWVRQPTAGARPAVTVIPLG